MDRAEQGVERAKDREEELGRLRGDVAGIMYESTEMAERLRPRLAEVQGLIKKLGPPPKPDAASEAPAVAAERARLEALARSLDGSIKTSELTWTRARQLIERITDIRHTLFARKIFQRLPSPLTPNLWRDVWSDFGSAYNTVTYIGSSWIATAAPKAASVLTITLVSLLLYWALRHTFSMFTASRRRQRTRPPTFFERAAAVTWFAPLRAIAPIFAAILLFVGLDSLDILYFWADRVLWAIIKSILIFSAIAALIVSVMAPSEPDWRLVPLSNRSSARISAILQGLTAVFAADLAFQEISRWLTLHVTVSIVETILANLAMAVLFAAIALTPLVGQNSEPGVVSRTRPLWIKAPIWLVVAAIVTATLMGYIALGRFIAHQTIVTGVVLVVTGLLYLAIRAFTREPRDAGLPVGELLETQFGLDGTRRQTLARLTELALTLLLLMLAIPFVMLQWGFSGQDIRDKFGSVVFGFEVGQFKISLASIVIAILLFVALVLVTRLFQRWLKDSVLMPARMDPGISNSIDTVIGYLGTALAALIAMSYAGFDITNLALVAGALSVGIGFGLQSIVNNFVSGLILLFERPVKVGDWIVVGPDEGIVRRISVRSTEIETFDRASVVVPNAELIVNRVKNWTLRDGMGRIRLPVGISYAADPDVASQAMLRVATENPSVLAYPAPFVHFDSFGDSSVNLVLNVYIADVTKNLSVKTALAFGIVKAFKAASIEIPFPQRDLHLKDLEPVRQSRDGSNGGAATHAGGRERRLRSACLRRPLMPAVPLPMPAHSDELGVTARPSLPVLPPCGADQSGRPAQLVIWRLRGQSSRWTRSLRSCRSCASTVSVAIGRASSRRSPIGSPVSSQ